MYQDREPTQRYIKRRKSRRASSMLMFTVAAILLATGAAFGMPWLSDLFDEPVRTSSANQAGVNCPQGLVGLQLLSDAQVEAEGDLFTLECDYALPPDTNSSASVSVTWTETESVESLLRGCGLPPSTTPSVFSVEGTQYGSIGQVRADYRGKTRYANAMQGLASDLVAAASTVAVPCNAESTGANPGIVQGGATGEDGAGDSGSGSGDATGESSSSGSTSGSSDDATAQSSNDTVAGNGSGDVDSSGNLRPGAQFAGRVVIPADVPEGSCIVHGRVTDAYGQPVPYIGIQILGSTGEVIFAGYTGSAGAYAFAEAVEANGSVALVPTDAGRIEPVFKIFAQQEAVTLSHALAPDLIEDSACEINFDLWNANSDFEASDGNVQRWASIIELYQNFNNAAELAIQVGAPLDYGLPVPVYAWCDSSSLFCDPAGVAEFAFYSGTTIGRTVDQPYIALGFPTSEIDYRGVPDNREYHEFGHAFFADVLGNQVPVAIGDRNHGGYYRNQHTTDSLVEGLSEFYSVMVSKHIDREDNPQRYRIGGEYDIEADRKPWEAVGWWEEFTLAGLLLDFEDGPEDYAVTNENIEIEAVSPLKSENGQFAIGRVRNIGTVVARNTEVTVQLLDSDGQLVFTQVTAVTPDSIAPGESGVFYVAAPGDVEFSDVEATAGRPVGTDDDSIDLELTDVLRAITSDWEGDPSRLTTVKDLYEILSDEFAGVDVDGDGTVDATQAEIDDIFIKHGFFDDLDGDRIWSEESDGEIGGTAHPAAQVGLNNFPAIDPRSSAIGFTGSLVDIDTAGVDAEMLVQVEMPDASQSYAYWTSDGSSAPVELAVPAASSDSSAVTVIATSDGHEPLVAYRITAGAFHAAVDSGEISTEPSRTAVEMREGDPLALLETPGDGTVGGSRAGAPPWTMVLPIALALVMLGGGFYVMRRSGPPSA